MLRQKFNPIAEAIAFVFHLWRHDPKSLLLAENQAAGLSASMDSAAAATSAALRGKPKRIRVRSPKLYACDIEVGGVYVPKRGNNRTPNIVVERVERESSGEVLAVRYRQRDDVHTCSSDEFLSLVARRIDNA